MKGDLKENKANSKKQKWKLTSFITKEKEIKITMSYQSSLSDDRELKWLMSKTDDKNGGNGKLV